MNYGLMRTSFLCLTIAGSAAAIGVSVCCKPTPSAVVAPVETVTIDPQPSYDAGADAKVLVGRELCAAACANLREIGCVEGSETIGDGCTAVCFHTLLGAFNIAPQCLASARDRDGVLSCKTVRCKTRDGG